MTLRLASVVPRRSAPRSPTPAGQPLARLLLRSSPRSRSSPLAALSALGDVLDGSAAEPHDRGIAVLSALALPLVLLGAAVRAPLLADGPPPVIGVTAVIIALAIFAIQALVTASVAVRASASAPPSAPSNRRARLERQARGRVAREVDQRLHEEERADRDDEREEDGALEQRVARRRAARDDGPQLGAPAACRAPGSRRGSSRARSPSRSRRRRSATTGPPRRRRRRRRTCRASRR